jgi:transcriptional regulator with AAA-type ATPase domain
LSARAQAKLLRAIQQQEIRRVGESFSRKIDVRIIAAANRATCGQKSAARLADARLQFERRFVEVAAAIDRARPARWASRVRGR